MCAVLPPSVSAVVVDESTVHGTVVQLQGTAVLDEVVDSPVTFKGEWVRRDMKNLSEFTSTSNTSSLQSPYTNTLTFNPLRNDTDDGGVYVYRLSVSPNDNTFFIKPASANDSVLLQVKQYPALNITLMVRTGVCVSQEDFSLSGNVSLLARTAPNYYLNYTWAGPLNEVISTSSNDFMVNGRNLVIKNLAMNVGVYKLSVCLSVPGSGLMDLCSSTDYDLIISSETTPIPPPH